MTGRRVSDIGRLKEVGRVLDLILVPSSAIRFVRRADKAVNLIYQNLIQSRI